MKKKSITEPTARAIDLGLMEEWLISLLAENSGFKHYYTFRKKHVMESMSVGVPEKDYWEMVGRIKEIRHLAAIAQDFQQKREKEKQKMLKQQKDKQ